MDLNYYYWLSDVSGRSIIGDLRNMATDCVENIRPRAQYLHFYRNIKVKITDYLSHDDFIKNKTHYEILGKINDYLGTIKPTNDNQLEISNKILEILNNYGINPSRDIREDKN